MPDPCVTPGLAWCVRAEGVAGEASGHESLEVLSSSFCSALDWDCVAGEVGSAFGHSRGPQLTNAS